MTIETKLTIGDTVWKIEENQVREGRVRCIRVTRFENTRDDVQYFVTFNTGEVELDEGHYMKTYFPTKNQLLDSL